MYLQVQASTCAYHQVPTGSTEYQKYLQMFTSGDESLELPHNSLFCTFPVTDDDAYTGCLHSQCIASGKEEVVEVEGVEGVEEVEEVEEVDEVEEVEMEK